jgi:hypothetical protein
VATANGWACGKAVANGHEFDDVWAVLASDVTGQTSSEARGTRIARAGRASCVRFYFRVWGGVSRGLLVLGLARGKRGVQG